MKRSPEFLLSNVGNNSILVPLGKATVNFNGIVSLNEMGVYIWNLLENDNDFNSLLSSVLSEFKVEKGTAEKDIAEFLDTLKTAGCIIE